MMGTIKTISLWQPWASLWVSGVKKHETRHWSTSYRGILLVHAAKRRIDDFEPDDPLREICEDQWGGHYPVDLPRGALVGFVTLADVFPTKRLPAFTDDDPEQHMGDFADGRFAWLAKNPIIFDRPIPYRGAQGFFNVAEDVIGDETLMTAKSHVA